VKTKKANDIDYVATWYYIETKGGPQGFSAEAVRRTLWGAPSNSDVWTSVEYAEVMYENGMIDASGHTSDGKYWRSRKKLGRRLSYYNVNRETADQLDCVMIAGPLP